MDGGFGKGRVVQAAPIIIKKSPTAAEKRR
jgi:hypothetical protein